MYIEEHTYTHGEEELAYKEMLNPSTVNIANVLNMILKPEQVVYHFEFRTADEYVIEEEDD